MLVQLLEKCRAEADSENPRFILVLNCAAAAGGQQASLEFTELNLFKHLCHLSLIVVKASDTQLKVRPYVSVSVLKLKEAEPSSFSATYPLWL
jgi:hypothetical protein